MMTAIRSSAVTSPDGTTIGYRTLGAGDAVILVGGSMRTGQDYLPLAAALAGRFTVHVVDRRGRGASGPQGEDYTIAKECEDLLAVQAETGATRVFGHSFGGLIVLETARRGRVFTRLAVYEPGVSVGGSIPTGWMPQYKRLLASGDSRGAFAHFIQQSGHAPGPVARLLLWYLRAVLRLVIRKPQWRRMEPLLAANLVEHEQVHVLDDTVAGYSAIRATVLLIAGSNSPQPATTRVLDELHRSIAGSVVDILDGLDHNAPDEKTPDIVGAHVLRFLQAPIEKACPDAANLHAAERFDRHPTSRATRSTDMNK